MVNKTMFHSGQTQPQTGEGAFQSTLYYIKLKDFINVGFVLLFMAG